MAAWFLIFSLFLPRITLLIAWCSGTIPHNTMPLFGDAVLAILIPRALILFYIWECLGFGGWFVAHSIAFFLAICLNAGRYYSKSQDD